jgi:hypothetical protein
VRRTAVVAALLAAFAIGACGDSPEDNARESGEDIGKAVHQMFTAESAEDAGEAIDTIRAEIEDMKEDTSDAVQEQIDTQRGSLEKAVEALQAGDTEEAKASIQDVRAQADSFRGGDSSIANEFWRGFEEGYDDD